MQFSPDNSLFAVGGPGGFVRLWETVSNREPRAIQAHDVSVKGLGFSRDGKVFATGSSDQTIKLWDVATGRNLATLRGHEHSMPSLDFTPDGKRLASAGWDHTIKIWDLSRPAAVKTISGFTLETRAGFEPIFSDDGKFAAALCVTNRSIWVTSLRESPSARCRQALRGSFSRERTC
jgi:WD40 repeat protein